MGQRDQFGAEEYQRVHNQYRLVRLSSSSVNHRRPQFFDASWTKTVDDLTEQQKKATLYDALGPSCASRPLRSSLVPSWEQDDGTVTTNEPLVIMNAAVYYRDKYQGIEDIIPTLAQSSSGLVRLGALSFEAGAHIHR